MARRFAKVSEEEIVAINEAAFFFIHLIGLILKQLSPSGSVKSGGYIPRRFASRYIYPPLFTFPSGDSCILLVGSIFYIFSGIFLTIMLA